MIYFEARQPFLRRALYSYRVYRGGCPRDPIEADIVIGVPDSGIPAAIGYSIQRHPLRFGLIKNRYVGRTFSPPRRCAKRDSREAQSLPDVLAGKRVVVIDDSTVGDHQPQVGRGNPRCRCDRGAHAH